MAGPSGRRSVTAAELAEYVYCPRAHWYSQVAPGAPSPPSAARRRAAGESYHLRAGEALRIRERRTSWYWAALGAGLLLVLLLLLTIFLGA